MSAIRNTSNDLPNRWSRDKVYFTTWAGVEALLDYCTSSQGGWLASPEFVKDELRRILDACDAPCVACDRPRSAHHLGYDDDVATVHPYEAEPERS